LGPRAPGWPQHALQLASAAQPREPSIIDLATLVDPQARPARDRPDVFGTDPAPRKQSDHPRCNLELDKTELGRRSRRLELDDRATIRGQEIADTRQKSVGVAADPDVSVEQKDRGPRSLTWDRIEHRSLHDPTAPRSRARDRARRGVNTKNLHPTLAQRLDEAPRTATDVENRTSQIVEDAEIGSIRRVGEVEHHGTRCETVRAHETNLMICAA